MAAKITYNEYVEYLCKRGGRNWTAAQLFADLEQSERKIVPCDCDNEVCQGWVCIWPTPEEYMARVKL